MKIEVGTKLFHNYGAMHPTYDSVVTSLVANDAVAVCKTEEGPVFTVYIKDIRPMGTRTAGGSPIGVFVMEEV